MDLHQFGELKKDFPEMKPGDTVRIHEKVVDKAKKKSQVFEGILIAKKHGKGINATFTLRAILDGVGVEKVYPLHSPLIEKMEVVKKGRARRAKLYYIREESQKKIRRKLKSKTVNKRETEAKQKRKTEAKPEDSKMKTEKGKTEKKIEENKNKKEKPKAETENKTKENKNKEKK